MVKTWQQKYDTARKAVTEKLQKKYGVMQIGDMMLISSPSEIDELVKTIPKGITKSITKPRSELAHMHGPDFIQSLRDQENQTA